MSNIAPIPEDEIFEHLAEHQLAICKECRHAIWPDQIEGHLQGKHHKIDRQKAIIIAERVRQWPGLVRYSSEMEVPVRVERPIKQLPLYQDGLLCQFDPNRCHYVCRDIKTMKKHWRESHQWSVGEKRGRPSRVREKGVERQVEESYKAVHCQRLFVQGRGSQYFEVRQPDGPAPIPIDGDALWAQLRNKVTKKWEEIEKKARTTIQEGEKDEVNPWLERTGWQKYLVRLERPDLLESIEEPNVDPKKEKEPVEAAIWEAMDGLARFSQASVIERIGVFVALEAIKTEKHQTRYQPLQPYMDEKSIVEHVRPWKQMLMFFARTQREHEWDSPKYRFTRRQREAWEALVDCAERQANGEEDEDH